MRLTGRSERLFDTDVQLGVTQAEPHTSAHSQRLGLLQFEQPDQSAVGPACLRFATWRRGNLHMIQDGFAPMHQPYRHDQQGPPPRPGLPLPHQRPVASSFVATAI